VPGTAFPHIPSPITSLDVAAGVVLIAGDFTAVGGQPRWGVAAVDAHTGLPWPWAPRLNSGQASRTYFVEIDGGRVWVSGRLIEVDGQPRQHIASFDLQGRLTAWAPEQPSPPCGLYGSGHASYFEDHLYVQCGYSVEASDGTLTLWTPDMLGNASGGHWSAAPGFGVVLAAFTTGGFFLYPRIEGPGPVSDLTADVRVNSVTFAWQGTSDAATYVVEAGSSSGTSNLARIDTHSTATTLTVDGPDGRYFVRVRAKALGGLGPVSNELRIALGPGACGAPPPSPTGLRADSAGPRVQLNWTPPIGEIEGTVVEASADGGASYVEVTRIPASASSFEGQGPPGQYLTRVRAGNLCGIGAPSAPVTITLTAVTLPPSPPSDLQATVDADRTVMLTWQASTGLPLDYLVEAGSTPGSSKLATFRVAGSPMAVSGVAPGTYYVRVRARNEGGLGAPSNEVAISVP
jgi:hypothetical protein